MFASGHTINGAVCTVLHLGSLLTEPNITMLKFKQAAERYLLKPKETLFDRGAAARLPEEYRKFWREWRETTPEPVHFIPEQGTWKKLETGEMKRIENRPIPGFFVEELNNVITGGEMAILGFTQKHKLARRNPRFWMPRVRKSAVYSEVLDKHIAVLMTRQAVQKIVEHQGFDYYVLRTRACDLGSLLSLKLKRKILLALRDKNLPYDDEKNKMIMNKYEEYMLPPKEIEWYGLSIIEALVKLVEEEQEEKIRNIVPYKHHFRQHLIKELIRRKETENDQKKSQKSEESEH